MLGAGPCSLPVGGLVLLEEEPEAGCLVDEEEE